MVAAMAVAMVEALAVGGRAAAVHLTEPSLISSEPTRPSEFINGDKLALECLARLEECACNIHP